MIRQMCPQCHSIVSVPDAAAGGTTDCPSCGKSFAVPANYTPAVVVEKPPEPPPPPLPPPPVEVEAPPPVDRPPPPPGLVELHSRTAVLGMEGYSHHRSVKVHSSLLAWFPAIALLVILVLTFFPWDGAFPGGYSGYTQSAWGALFGGFYSNPVVEDILKLESKLRTTVSWDWVMIPYLLGLIFAVYVAVAERLFHKPTTPAPKAVAWMGTLWTHRITFLTALTGTLLCLLVIQMLAGFGLENGVRKEVATAFAEERQKAGTVTAEQNKIDIREDMVLGSYHLGRTTWFDLALVLNILALAALLGRIGMERRGAKPPPRFVVEY